MLKRIRNSLGVASYCLSLVFIWLGAGLSDEEISVEYWKVVVKNLGIVGKQ